MNAFGHCVRLPARAQTNLFSGKVPQTPTGSTFNYDDKALTAFATLADQWQADHIWPDHHCGFITTGANIASDSVGEPLSNLGKV